MSKVKQVLAVDDFHKSYRIRCLEKKITPKSREEYRRIITAMGEAIGDILVEDGIVGLPWRMGDVLLRQTTEPQISKKGGKRTLLFNDHSDGIGYRSFWLSPERQKKKRKSWGFSLSRVVRPRIRNAIYAGRRYANWQLLNPRAQKGRSGIYPKRKII